MDIRTTCQLCGEKIDVGGEVVGAEGVGALTTGRLTALLVEHLANKHPEISLDRYMGMFPHLAVVSPLGAEAAPETVPAGVDAPLSWARSRGRLIGALWGRTGRRWTLASELFRLRPCPQLCDYWGRPLTTFVLLDDGGHAALTPTRDPTFVFEPSLLRSLLTAFDLRIPAYLWGHAGVGKSSAIEQVCAHTNRPMIRVQHTANMEESHVLGQYLVKDGETVWEEGPLPFAMRNGLVYLADEYDFALPHVLGVYQAVLEGKPLFVKEAPPARRIVEPHVNFRFVATGNTNGAGDDTGLYQGTALQNFANYERFGVMEQVSWMEPEKEEALLMNQARLHPQDAKMLVDFAGEVRRAHEAGRIGATVSPRALVNAAKVAPRVGGVMAGVRLSFINRLSAVDREISAQIAQRVFG